MMSSSLSGPACLSAYHGAELRCIQAEGEHEKQKAASGTSGARRPRRSTARAAETPAPVKWAASGFCQAAKQLPERPAARPAPQAGARRPRFAGAHCCPAHTFTRKPASRKAKGSKSARQRLFFITASRHSTHAETSSVPEGRDKVTAAQKKAHHTQARHKGGAAAPGCLPRGKIPCQHAEIKQLHAEEKRCRKQRRYTSKSPAPRWAEAVCLCQATPAQSTSACHRPVPSSLVNSERQKKARTRRQRAQREERHQRIKAVAEHGRLQRHQEHGAVSALPVDVPLGHLPAGGLHNRGKASAWPATPRGWARRNGNRPHRAHYTAPPTASAPASAQAPPAPARKTVFSGRRSPVSFLQCAHPPPPFRCSRARP